MRDFTVTPDLDAHYTNATLEIEVDVQNLANKNEENLSLQATLKDVEGRVVATE